MSPLAYFPCALLAGSKYPPPLSAIVQLREALAGGALATTFTGGGCLLKRLTRSKGRYVLCVAQHDKARVEGLLQQLPPIVNAFLLAKRGQAEQQAQAVATRAAVTRAAGGGQLDGGQP